MKRALAARREAANASSLQVPAGRCRSGAAEQRSDPSKGPQPGHPAQRGDARPRPRSMRLIWGVVVLFGLLAFAGLAAAAAPSPKGSTDDPLDTDTAAVKRAFALFDAERLEMDAAIIRGARQARRAAAAQQAADKKKADKKSS